MNADNWQQLKTIFHAALELSPSERAAYLARECDGEEELRTELEKLFAANDQPGAFLVSPAVLNASTISGDTASKIEAERAGQRIGPYEIIREIGRGGMGTVYLAVRADDQYRKQVAIKLINRGMDTDL